MNTSRMANTFVRLPRKPISGFVVALLVVQALLLSFSTPAAAARPARVVAVGDIHGGLDELVAILQQAKLINARHRWVGRSATLVQTGDFLDRGPKSRQVMDLLMALEKQARKKGGRVLVLLGNHEMMNLTGDLRYVTAEDYASFANGRSVKRRSAAYQSYMEWRRSRAQALDQPLPVFTAETENEWMEKHPLGFVEHREAFGLTGKYGRWLRQRPAIAQVGDGIFLHGGIHPALASWTVEEINNRIGQEIRAFDGHKQYLIEQKLILPFFTFEEITAVVQTESEAQKAALEQRAAEAAQRGETYEPAEKEKQHLKFLEEFLGYGGWFSLHPDGPLWFRGFALWPEEEGASHVTSLLGALGAANFVVGHTPQDNGQIRSRFGHKVFLIDTGMLTSYYAGGRPSALEIQEGKLTAIYLDQRTLLLDRSEASLRSSQDRPQAAVPPLAGSWTYKPQDQPPLVPPTRSARVWLDPDGRPLPFTTDEEVLEFLRTARVVRVREVGEGITRPKKVLLENNGLRMHAIFRDVNQEKAVARLVTGATEIGFRDDYIFECAAYELSRLLGLDNVPPAVTRRIQGKRGSLQVWIENAMTETTRKLKRKIPAPDTRRWNQQMYILHIFDELIYNTDRNWGNILIDPNWKLWMVDHTRAFRRFGEPNNLGRIAKCERTLWEKLQTLDEATAKKRLRRFLRSSEIRALLKRRQKLVEHIQKLIQERGEELVLYTYE